MIRLALNRMDLTLDKGESRWSNGREAVTVGTRRIDRQSWRRGRTPNAASRFVGRACLVVKDLKWRLSATVRRQHIKRLALEKHEARDRGEEARDRARGCKTSKTVMVDLKMRFGFWIATMEQLRLRLSEVPTYETESQAIFDWPAVVTEVYMQY